MTYISVKDRLQKIYNSLMSGERVDPVAVRLFLAWFGAERRGYWVVSKIRVALDEAKLKTVPDFDGIHIDSNVQFALSELKQKAKKSEIVVSSSENETIEEVTTSSATLVVGAIADPAFRIGRLQSANTKPLSVAPDATLSEAVTLMLRHDFSQLPVMTNNRDVKGVVSWESIGSRLSLGKSMNNVRECMKTHHEVASSDSLFRVMPFIVEHSYVLVRGESREINGIVTTADLSLQFRQLSEPFLLLSEIENHIRRMIDGKFTIDELSKAKDSADPIRKIESVADLTFGEYIRLLENLENWNKMGLAVDRVIFVKELDKVRKVRNDVMHFDPDGITESDHRLLLDFVNFCHKLHEITK